MTPDTVLSDHESARATRERIKRLVLDYYPRDAGTVEVVIVAVDGSAAATLTFGSLLWVDSAKFCKERM